jgi:hypothetical protein
VFAEVNGHEYEVRCAAAVAIVFENVGIFDDAQSQGEIVLIYAHAHTRRYHGFLEIYVLKHRSNTFALKPVFKLNGAVVGVYGNCDLSQCISIYFRRIN